MNKGIAIVHGVGDPLPGDAVDQVVEGLCGRFPGLRLEARGRRRVEEQDLEVPDPQFEIWQRRLVHESSATTLIFSEVFWGDLSRAGKGWPGLVAAVGSLMMGLHALVFAGGGLREGNKHPGVPDGTRDPEMNRWGLWVTFWSAFLGAYHIKGVLIPLASLLLLLALLSLGLDSVPASSSVFAVTVLAGILVLLLPDPRPSRGRVETSNSIHDERGEEHISNGWVRPKEWLRPLIRWLCKKRISDTWVKPTPRFGFWCAVGYLVPICWLLLVRGRLAPNRTWVPGAVFLLVFGLANLLVIVLTRREQWECRQGKNEDAASSGRSFRWVAIIGIIGAVVPWGWLIADKILRHRATPENLEELGSVLASAYHLALGSAAVWVLLVLACYGLTRLAERKEKRSPVVRRAKVIFLGYALECSLWIAVTTALMVLAQRLPGQEHLRWLGLTAYRPGTWLHLTAIAFPIGLVGIALWTWLKTPRRGPRRHRGASAGTGSSGSEDELPPFAIAALVGSWPLLAATALTAAACVVGVLESFGPPLPEWRLFRLPWFGQEIGALVVLVLVVAIRQLQEPLRLGLDLANDVTAYFRGRSWASRPYDRKDRILRQRFTMALEDLEKQGAEAIIVVSHSQGSVIAAQGLEDWFRRAPGRSGVKLLTMGSPLRSLYGEFFPHEFGGPVLAVESWTNLYRWDDFVARGLEDECEKKLEGKEKREPGSQVVDQEIGGRGHTGYWTEPAVLVELGKLLGLELAQPPAR